MSTFETPAPPKEESAKGKGGKIAIAAVAAVALFAGGILAGLGMADPTTSDEYATAVSHVQAAGTDRDKYRGQLEDMTTKYNTLVTEQEKRDSALTKREEALGEKESAVAESEAAVEQREKAVGTAEAKAEANTVSDGTWTVGEDINPGTYRATADVGSTCYWGIYKSGSNGDTIISNDIPGGGRPTVTLSKGQDFNSTRCGSWQKK